MSEAEVLLYCVAFAYEVSLEAIKGRGRDRHLALARHVGMYKLRQDTDLTLREVGELLGGRSPATVSYGYQAVAHIVEQGREI